MLEPQNFWGSVKNFFAREESIEAQAVAHSKPRPLTRPASISQSQNHFEGRLRQLIERTDAPTTAVLGRVNLLSLATVRDKLGSRWPRLESHVHNTVERVLERRLSDGDLYTRHGDSYVIVFGTSTPEEARLKCALLAEEVLTRILGEEGKEECADLGVRAIVVETDGQLAARSLTTLDAISELISRAEEVHLPDDTSAAMYSATRVHETDVSSLARLLEEAGARLKDAPQQAVDQLLANIDEAGKTIERLGSEGTSWLNQQADSPIAKALARANKILGAAAGQKPGIAARITSMVARAKAALDNTRTTSTVSRQTEPELIVTFQPMVHTENVLTLLQACELAIQEGSSLLSWQAAQDDDIEPRLVAQVDQLTLRLLAQRFAHPAKPLGYFLIPLHYATTARDQALQNYMIVCQDSLATLRRHVIFDIVCSPLTSLHSRLHAVIGALKPHCRAVFVRVPVDHPNFDGVLSSASALQRAGVQGLVLDLTGSRLTDAEALARIDRVAALADRLRLTSCILGADRMVPVVGAFYAGIQHIAGRALSEHAPEPGELCRLSLEDLYQLQP